MVSNRACAVLVLVVCWAAQINSDFMTMKELQDNLGYFGKCKNKTIHYPAKAVADGLFIHMPKCVPLLTVRVGEYTGGELSKPCVAMCVAMSMGIIDKDRHYNLTAAAKPLLESVNSTDANVRNDADVIKIQVDALEKCGTVGSPRFLYVEKCAEAKKFDACIKKAAVEDCQNGEEPPK